MPDLPVSVAARGASADIDAAGPVPPTAPATATVTVRYFAAARAAAGTDADLLTLDVPATIGAVLDAVVHMHGEDLRRVLTRCSYLKNATAVRDLAAPVHSGDELDILPPFAGG